MRTDPFGNPLPPRMHYRASGYDHVSSRRGKRVWTPLGKNYTQALTRWSRIEGAGTDAVTVAQMVEAYLIEHGDRLADKTLRGYRNSQDRINDWAGPTYGEELERAEVRAWLHNNKHRATSANRDMALLKAALNHAVECGQIATASGPGSVGPFGLAHYCPGVPVD